MNVFIIGGTSGIGLALAYFYQQNGHRVGICGRDLRKLTCESPFEKYKVNVIDKELLASTIRQFVGTGTLSLLINCAGSYAEDVVEEISYNDAVMMLQTNIIGAINTLEIGRELMACSGGQIALLASISGILDYPQSSLYTKTKRSVLQIADAYSRALRPLDIHITAIAPGYVATQKLYELNQNNLSKKPFLVSEARAVVEISEAIAQKKALHLFPTRMKWLMRLLSSLPKPLLSLFMYRKAKWMQNN
ncbi:MULTISPECIES: SDR family NAD(P)-dependent oxidoreductase [unclassified Capnocytophaga]|jgi:3-oxoacyl-[acyl-carrier-protein] reductase|uniref:SDR family NAD(P)-dependent oxidoreductase n=1 Tax=unclassified Capnocytophaga TaxID=2640652 RepID=UPI000202D14A|nr:MULTISPECIES: SDR family NAD(P)-dependent oxidoreductase [unclassified Capnocytophaga]EGD34492.1 3-oxoacyl-[acyl-carrier protein] reductase [Capnocytophaga sp. oral taxon 338 str. F0234]MEB3005260.1 SDR family NAD(P)-dependent oxidoreductase [Capnocytophaga sp. G2]